MMALTKCPEPEDISGMYCSVNMLLHKANNDIYQCNKFIKLKRGQLNSDSMEGRYKYVLWFPHKNDVRFMSCLRSMCLLAHSGVQRILCFVLFYFSSSCVPYVASFSGLSIFWLHLRYSLTSMKRKFKRWWSTIPPISTKRTIIFHRNSLVLAWDRHTHVSRRGFIYDSCFISYASLLHFISTLRGMQSVHDRI